MGDLPTSIRGVIFGYFTEAELFVFAGLCGKDAPDYNAFAKLASGIQPQAAAMSATRCGWDDGLRAILAEGEKSPIPSECKLLSLAAAHNNISTMKLLVSEFSVMDFDDALLDAAAHGHIPAMELIKGWNVGPPEAPECGMLRTSIDALVVAADAGHVPAMKWIKAWHERASREDKTLGLPFRVAADNALVRAATHGHIHAMELAKEWGAVTFRAAYYSAMLNGHAQAAALAEGWILPTRHITSGSPMLGVSGIRANLAGKRTYYGAKR